MMHPLIAHETIEAMQVLMRACRTMAQRCIAGIEADAERCAYWLEWSLALVTPLAHEIGYDRAAALAYRAYRERRPIREIVREDGTVSPEKIDRLLDPKSMIM